MTISLVQDLLQQYRENKTTANPKKLTFHEVGDRDVYNPTGVFPYKGENLICARVEHRDSEHAQAVFFFEKEQDHFYPYTALPRYTLQDPFLSKMSNGYLFGGTEIFQKENTTKLYWRTKLFFGETLETLKPLLNGPDGMKDIRLVELADKRIGIFTRPQGEKGGRGKIGFTIVNTLQDVTVQVIDAAPLLDLFVQSQWGGANEPLLLEDGRIGVLGHIANFSEGDVRHYYPTVFTIDPLTRQYTGMKIIAERSDFLDGPSKRADLQDVLFSGGFTGIKEAYVTLTVGASDCEVHCIEMKNPFRESEQ